MLPASTASPPNFLTPRRRPAESRPLREEPPAFLCAICQTPSCSGFFGRRLLGRGGLFGRGLLLGRRLGFHSLSRFRLGGRCLGLGFRLRLLAADCQDLQDRVLLTMAVLAAVIVAALLLEDDDLVGLRLRDDLGRDLEAVGRLQLGSLAGEQDIAQLDLVTGRTGQLLDDDLVSCGNTILLTAGAHHCEHGFYYLRIPVSHGRLSLTRAGATKRKPTGKPPVREAAC